MIKSNLLLIFILAIQFTGYSQWEEKNISMVSTLTGLDFLNNDVGFVVGVNRIFKTEDGGDNWATVHTSNATVLYEDVIAIDDDIIIAVGKYFTTNETKITRTTNGGIDWTDIPISNTSLLTSIFFSSPEVGYCCGSGGTILKSIDFGETWQELDSGILANLNSIYFVNDMVGITVGGGTILKTQDGGESWNQIDSPSNNNLRSAFFSNQNTGYIVGWNGEIIKTTDCGNTWSSQSSVSMQGNLSVVFTDDDTGYIVGGSMDESLIQKTTNAGESWEDISPQISQGLSAIYFPSFDVGYTVGANGTVLKTESGGVMTSTNDFEIFNAFDVFPNPTSDVLNVQSENNNQIIKVRIYDSNGRVIKELEPNAPNSEIDFSDLPSNIYYLEIQSEQRNNVQKVVKN